MAKVSLSRARPAASFSKFCCHASFFRCRKVCRAKRSRATGEWRRLTKKNLCRSHKSNHQIICIQLCVYNSTILNHGNPDCFKMIMKGAFCNRELWPRGKLGQSENCPIEVIPAVPFLKNIAQLTCLLCRLVEWSPHPFSSQHTRNFSRCPSPPL